MAYDEVAGENESYGFGERKLKDDAFVGKVMAGYEYEMSAVSLLFEAGYLVDTTKAKYDHEMPLSTTFDRDLGVPTITSMKLKRNRTFSLGLAAKKGVSDKLSMLAGLDVLHSQFQYQATATGSYTPGVGGVVRRKSRFGLGPWVGMSWDMGMIEAGLRYQYAKYQKLKLSGEFSGGKFSVSNKIKPEYHTLMVTVTKKF